MNLIAKDNFLVGIARFRVVFEFWVLVDRRTSGSGASRVASLNDKPRDDAVEDGTGVVAVETVLDKVLARERGLFGEEGDVERTDGGVEGDGSGCRRFSVVLGRHGELCPLSSRSLLVRIPRVAAREKALVVRKSQFSLTAETTRSGASQRRPKGEISIYCMYLSE